jgi:hypothetical protein
MPELSLFSTGDVGDFGDIESHAHIERKRMDKNYRSKQKLNQVKAMSPKSPTSPEHQITL